MTPRRLLVALSLAGLAACLLLGCATPQPPPTPTPSAGPFTNAIIDCASPEVDQESVAALPAVTACLVGTATTACLDGLYPNFTINTVACLVRQEGVGANVRVLSGQPRANDTTIDGASRQWIEQQHLGYRSVRR